MLSPWWRPTVLTPLAPLWRAAQVFRLLSCLYALGFQIAVNSDLQRRGLAWLLFAVLVGWSVACAIAYLHGFGRRPMWVIAEILVAISRLEEAARQDHVGILMQHAATTRRVSTSLRAA